MNYQIVFTLLIRSTPFSSLSCMAKAVFNVCNTRCTAAFKVCSMFAIKRVYPNGLVQVLCRRSCSGTIVLVEGESC